MWVKVVDDLGNVFHRVFARVFRSVIRLRRFDELMHLIRHTFSSLEHLLSAGACSG